jgi:HEAT repeat protein
VYQRLLKIFTGSDEENKFQACFALMHQFQHQPAIDYLLQQTASPDRERACRATLWIGDVCNWGQPAYPALLEALDPLLVSKDQELRRTAVDALTIYAGPAVTDRLLDALADEDREIVETARRSLTERAIGRAVRLRETDLATRLQSLAETHENARVRRECAAILEAVQLQQDQSASRQ